MKTLGSVTVTTDGSQYARLIEYLRKYALRWQPNENEKETADATNSE